MSTSALRIALAAQLNACARSMMVAWGTIVTAFEGQLEVPEPIDFPTYSAVHVVLVPRIGELGREQAFELALLEREIEWQAQTFRRTIKGAIDLPLGHAPDLVSQRYGEAQALADRIDAFVEVLLSDSAEPDPSTSSGAMRVDVVNEAGDIVHASAKRTAGANGLPSVEIMVRRVASQLARRVQSGEGALHGAIASRFGVKAKPGGGDA